MAKERILIVTERFYPEEFLINDLAQEMHQRSLYIEILTQIPSYPFDKVYKGYKNKFFSIDNFEGIKIHRVYTHLGYNKSILKKIWGYLIFAALTWIKAFSLAKSFDKIFFYHTGPATMAHSSFVFKKVFNKKCIIWTQDIWPDAVFASGVKETPLRRRILEFYLKKLYLNFDKVLVSCQGFIPIIKYYYSKKIEYCPQWYPGEELNLVANKIKAKVQFTFLGNIGSVQNLENVCNGFLQAVRGGINAQLNIVGDGIYLEKLQVLVKKSGSQDIILWGRKPAEEMPSFIERSNILIISLKDDPLFNLYVPGKFQSYLVGGRPIFGIINGAVADIIRNNQLGYVSEPSNLDCIAEGFQSLANDESLWEEIGQRSRQFYEENYRKEACIKRILNSI